MNKLEQLIATLYGQGKLDISEAAALYGAVVTLRNCIGADNRVETEIADNFRTEYGTTGVEGILALLLPSKK